MSISSIITNLSKPNKIVDPFLGIAVFSFDAVTEITHSRTAVPTTNPVENGTTITDHVVLQPLSLQVSGIVSESPLRVSFSLITAGITAIPNPVARRTALLSASIANLVKTKVDKRVQTAFDYLNKLWENRQPFTFVSKLKTYKNMIITSLLFPIATPRGHDLPISMTLQQINIATGSIVELSKYLDKIGGASAAAGSVGKETAKAASQTTAQAANGSVAFNIWSSLAK